MTQNDNLFDVIAVEIKSPHTKRLIAERLTEANADAAVRLAVMRRGVDVEFFKAVPHPAGQPTQEPHQ